MQIALSTSKRFSSNLLDFSLCHVLRMIYHVVFYLGRLVRIITELGVAAESSSDSTGSAMTLGLASVG